MDCLPFQFCLLVAAITKSRSMVQTWIPSFLTFLSFYITKDPLDQLVHIFDISLIIWLPRLACHMRIEGFISLRMSRIFVEVNSSPLSVWEDTWVTMKQDILSSLCAAYFGHICRSTARDFYEHFAYHSWICQILNFIEFLHIICNQYTKK